MDIKDKTLNAVNAVKPLRISESVSKYLPELIKPVVMKYKGLERDYFFSALLPALGSVMYKSVVFYYRKHNPLNLYFLGLGNAGRGKGAVNDIREILSYVDSYIQLKNKKSLEKYQSEEKKIETVEGSESEKPKHKNKPKKILKILGGNVSYVRLIEHLYTNGFENILLFGTEADTVSKMFNSEWGNYSTLLREAYHQEPLSDSKKEGDRFIEVSYPLLSIILTGTPNQVNSLISQVENGLFSRFIYMFDIDSMKTNDPSPKAENSDTSEYLIKCSKDLLILYKKLVEIGGINVQFTDKQWDIIRNLLKSYENNIDYSFKLDGSIIRLGLILSKISSILTIARNYNQILDIPAPAQYNMSEVSDSVGLEVYNEEKEIEKIRSKKTPKVPTNKLICSNTDFIIGLKLIRTYLNNAEAILKLFEKSIVFFSETEEIFFNRLNIDFNKNEFKTIATDLGISLRTADSYIERWIELKAIKRIKRGQYRKCEVD